MANSTKDQLIFLTTAYFSQGKGITRAQRTFQKEYKVKTSPSKKIVLRCLKNFSSSGNLDKKKSKGRSVSVTTASNLEKAKQIIEEKRNVSLRHLSQQLGTSYLKDKVYRDNPKTVTELKEAIATEIRAIGPGVTSAVMNSMKKRAEICIQSGGRHMKNIIFHK